MIKLGERIGTYPQIGSYGLAFKYFFEKGLGIEYMMPPKMTQRTLALGEKYSPDSLCAPFKYMLGSYIEAIEKGANILIGLGGFCRLDFFFELQRDIIKDYRDDLIFVNFSQTKASDIGAWYEKFKDINPDLSILKLAKAMPVLVRIIESIDEVEDYIRKNKAYGLDPRDFDKIYSKYLRSLEEIRDGKDLDNLHKKVMSSLENLPRKDLDQDIKIAIVGEYYTIMESFANHYVEDFLIERSISLDRWVDFTNTLIKRPLDQMQERIKKYSAYDMGATNIFTIERALHAGESSYDGIIHLRSMGCTPEIDAQAVLDNISREFDIPILYLTYDSETTDIGINTRLEAFYDMITMKKRLKEVI